MIAEIRSSICFAVSETYTVRLTVYKATTTTSIVDSSGSELELLKNQFIIISFGSKEVLGHKIPQISRYSNHDH